jgi:hypothetical protein
MPHRTRRHCLISLSPFACRLKRRAIGFRRSSEVACGLEIGIPDDSAIDDQHSLCHLDAHRSMEVTVTEWIEILLAFAQHLQQVSAPQCRHSPAQIVPMFKPGLRTMQRMLTVLRCPAQVSRAVASFWAEGHPAHTQLASELRKGMAWREC